MNIMSATLYGIVVIAPAPGYHNLWDDWLIIPQRIVLYYCVRPKSQQEQLLAN